MPGTPTSDSTILDAATAERVRASIAQPLLTTLGVTVEHLAAGHVELALARRADLIQQHGFIHAGAVTTIADSATAPAAQPAFLTSGTVIRAGRTLTVCRDEVHGIGPDGQRTLVASSKPPS